MTLGETAPIRTSHLFKLPDPLPFVRREPTCRESLFGYRDGRERGACICVSGTSYFLPNQKKRWAGCWGGALFTTCGRDLFRISMTIDLHVWSSIAGYGSRKRSWLEDQKCGQFTMVVRAHFRAFFPRFLFLHFLPCDKTFSDGRLMFILFHHDNVMGGFGHWLY